jgi:hypothetical protein
VHVDLELNAVVVTELDASAAIVRRRVQVGDGAGLIALRDAWVKRISRLFLARTRFDPLHLAATEQSL